jgi:hypothetical protein
MNIQRVFFTISIAVGLASLTAADAQAQQYESPVSQSCVQQFYDPQSYNWLAFENECSDGIKIVFVPNGPGGSGGEMDLAPGRHEGTGQTASEVSRHNGFKLFVCPANHVPVDSQDRYVNRNTTAFHCKEE